jgi:predicted RecA/RadA family phage recombinase
MQARFVQDDGVFDYTPATAVNGGDVVVTSTLVGIAKRDIAANVPGSLHTKGIFDIVKANEEIAAGTKVYWDADGNPYGGTAGTGAITATSAGNTYMGKTTEHAAADDPTVNVLLGGDEYASITQHEMLSAIIADPGNAGAIPVTGSGHVDIVTAGAETRTLAAPSFLGQMLLVSMKTDGGDCVITCATTVNQTGNNTITLNDAGDAVLLQAKANGANKRWSVVSNDGGALSTV